LKVEGNKVRVTPFQVVQQGPGTLLRNRRRFG